MSGIGQTYLLQALGWAILNSLWQMALLWVIYQFITWALRSSKSSFKSGLASLLLISGFAWFLLTFVSILLTHRSGESAIQNTIAGIGNNDQLNQWLQRTLPLAAIIYLFLLVFPLMHFIRNYRYVKVIRMYGLTKANAEWRLFVKKVANMMGIRKPVQIWISEFVTSPVTIGYLKPVILVPLAAINHLTTQQLEAVLLHELSHIRRHDYLINLLINFIQTILYYNPFVKALVKIVEREREKSCDEIVMQFQYAPVEYANALLTLEKTNEFNKPLAVAASGKKNDLLHRIELILGINRKPVFSFNKIAGLFAGLLCIIALNALMILSKPSRNSEALAFEQLPSAFYFFSPGSGLGSPASSSVSNPTISEKILNATATTKNGGNRLPLSSKKRRQELAMHHNLYPSSAFKSDFVNVNFETPVVPVLKKYQEVQLRQSVEASRKVIEESQWKSVEKKIADVLTREEKERLKQNYQTAMDRLDWSRLEDRLRLSYDQVDWESFNEQLGKAVNQIRLDSLRRVYSDAASRLDFVVAQLLNNNLKGIPDTDVTLKEVQDRKDSVHKVLNSMTALKAKKIVKI